MKQKHLVQKQSKTYRFNPLVHFGLIILTLFAVFMLTNTGQQAASSAGTVIPAAETNAQKPDLDVNNAAEYLKEYRVNPTTNPPLSNLTDVRDDAIGKSREALALVGNGQDNLKQLINEAISALQASIRSGTDDIQHRGIAIDKLQQAVGSASGNVREKLRDALGLLIS